ncbi:unnamed protein product, partial [Allacma fusca]
TPPPEVKPVTSASPILKRAVVKGSHENFPKALYNHLVFKMVAISFGSSKSSTDSRKSNRSSIPELQLNPILARPAAKAVAHRNYRRSRLRTYDLPKSGAVDTK